MIAPICLHAPRKLPGNAACATQLRLVQHFHAYVQHWWISFPRSCQAHRAAHPKARQRLRVWLKRTKLPKERKVNGLLLFQLNEQDCRWKTVPFVWSRGRLGAV